MSKFNLIEESWIPCLMLKTNEMKEFGLKDALIKANEIKEIADNSPFVVVSLHRLLLAILHRNFGPKSFNDWKQLWSEGKWDEQILEAYFENWKERFNLFDEERPFYQYPKVNKKDGKEADAEPLELLIEEKASGNNKTLFDHSYNSKETPRKPYTPNIAARYLIARQSFALLGRGYSYSTMIKGLSVWAMGKNLFETLALNLVAYDPSKNKPIVAAEKNENGESPDKPFWERGKLTQAASDDKDGTLPLGYLDYLTWQSRRIQLIQSEDRTVMGCRLQQNYKLDEGEHLSDPFKVYIKVKGKGFKPLNLNPNKALWRDSHAIFNQEIEENKRGALFNHLAQIYSAVREKAIRGNQRYELSVYGVTKLSNAKFDSWRQERMPLPLDYLDNQKLLESLKDATGFAEEIGKILQRSMRKLAKELHELQSNLANNFPSMSFYWASLEHLFYNLLLDLPENEEKAKREWAFSVKRNAEEGFRKTADSLSGSAMEQKAIIASERYFYGSIRKYLNKNSEYGRFFPKKEKKR